MARAIGYVTMFVYSDLSH